MLRGGIAQIFIVTAGAPDASHGGQLPRGTVGEVVLVHTVLGTAAHQRPVLGGRHVALHLEEHFLHTHKSSLTDSCV